jgi:hypothetical protein
VQLLSDLRQCLGCLGLGGVEAQEIVEIWENDDVI